MYFFNKNGKQSDLKVFIFLINMNKLGLMTMLFRP